MTDRKTFTGGAIHNLNTALSATGVELVPKWRLDAMTGIPEFSLRNHRYSLFIHGYNCGFPPARMTERGLELAIADHWLDRIASRDIVEIGAVTPYYWPHRVASVVDPFDPHHLVTARESLLDCDLSGKTVLAVSTLEHIGMNEYGVGATGESAVQALSKICDESPRFLITCPFGYNPQLDEHLFAEATHLPECRVTYMVRSETGNDWHETSVHEARVPYGGRRGREFATAWANAIAVIERGDVL